MRRQKQRHYSPMANHCDFNNTMHLKKKEKIPKVKKLIPLELNKRQKSLIIRAK